MPENNSNKGNNQKAQNTGADRSASEKKSNIAKEAYSAYREAKDVNKASNSRRQVDDALNGTGSESLQKMGVPKGIADKAVKDGGGKLFPGNSPVNNFVKNKTRDALAKGLDKLGGKNSSNKNFGAKLLNNMGNRVKPNNQNGNKQADNIKKATEIAKKVPIPQVQAAAKAVDAANKLGITDKLTSKNNGNKNNPFQISGFVMKKKIMMFSLVFIGALIVFSVMFSLVSVTTSASGGEVNEGLCVSDTEYDEKCDESDPDANEFYARVKEVKQDFVSNGKTFDTLYIAGFYSAVSSENGSDISYKDMTKDKIEDIANAMFKEDGTSFDEETFKKNLKDDILPSYIPDKTESEYDHVIARIFEYVDNFRNIYGEDVIDYGNYCITSDLTADTLCNLRNEGKLDEWVNQFGPVAQQDYSRTGIFASITMAQAIIESGWACSDIQNNLFGIKCSGYKTCTTVLTHEEVNGQSVATNASFRTYNNIAESIQDHSRFLQENSRYAQHGVFSSKSYQEQARSLKAAGYATSSVYAETLINTIESYNLDKWDSTVNTTSSSICGGNGKSLSGWTLRTVAPTASDKAFNYKNSNRGQCVWYAQARAIEIAQDLASKGKITNEQEEKIRTTLLNIYGDGGMWLEASSGKFKTSTNIKDLKAGSIISWKQSGGYGHVAVIEDVTDQKVTITEGWAKNTTSCPNNWNCINFNTKTISLDEYYNSYGKYYNGNSYSFNGYIYFLEPA